MHHKIIQAAVLAATLFLSGCISFRSMPLADDKEKLADKKQPVFLMTATLTNTYKPAYRPRLLVVHLRSADPKGASPRLEFLADDKADDKAGFEATGGKYLARFDLEPGPYKLEAMSSTAGSVLLGATFVTPLQLPLEAKAPGVYYLGHLRANVRERGKNEFMAGPVIPLISQLVVGASDGTFDVEVKDDWASDEAIFRDRFPALAGVTIQKAILPPFDRAAAQRFWEGKDRDQPCKSSHC